MCAGGFRFLPPILLDALVCLANSQYCPMELKNYRILARCLHRISRMTTQPSQRSRPLVAIINTALESIELLEAVLADEGMDSVSAYNYEFKRGDRDLEAFFGEHQPDAVIYDIGIPYLENWKYFREQVLAPQYLPEQRFVITTTNRTVLEMLVGPTAACELVGRPYDLDTIADSVKHAINTRSE